MKYDNDSYVSLHNHTSYSMLDGASKIPELVAAAVHLDQPGLASTDHGNCHALPEFYRECKSVGINPILGSEVYFTEDASIQEKTESGKQAYHLILMAENNVGYHNLMKLSSLAYLEGFYYKPRVDWAMLEQYSDGLLATTGCLGGIVLQKIMAGDVAGAERDAARLQDIFGKGNLYVELQNHHMPEQMKTNPVLIDIARSLGAPIISTNDTHYVNHDDHTAHDSLLCLQTGSKIADADRFRFSSDEHYLKSSADMRALFPALPEAANNTLEINERANVSLDFGTLHLPKVDVPSTVPVHEGVSPEGSWLALLANGGLNKRYGAEAHLHVERLQYELSSVESLGLSAYFLIVWDIIKFSDQQRIARGPGRGSAAGSLISYCMNITKVDPMRHGLMFERFLNPSRIAMPDIDLDFSPRHRDKIINYITEKYGQEQVSQIVTFSTIKGRSAIRDATRVLGYAPKVGDIISKMMPDSISGFSASLEACMSETVGEENAYRDASELRQFYHQHTDAHEVVDVALGLEGLVRQTGTGAAGVLITPGPVTDYVPVQTQGTGDDKHVVTQYDKNICEDLGLVKMDILGLRNLDVMDDTGSNIDFYSEEFLRFDDINTFELFQRGDTIGVFQLESPPMRELLKAVHPTTIDDIAAVVALYRPGPMGTGMHTEYANRKNGRAPVSYFHEDAREILKDTFGLMIYQEQSMKLAQKFCGYTGADADNLRKIIGKKLVDKMSLERQKMIDGAEAGGYGRELGEKLYEMTESSALYSFNEAHAVSYAYIAYQTAFLKANYPVAYMAALVDSLTDKDKCAASLAEARRMGIEILPPDVRVARTEFSPTDAGAIRFGLGGVKFVGSDTIERIMEWQGDPESSPEALGSFLSAVLPNSREFTSLAAAGALDAFGSRRGLMVMAPELASQAKDNDKDAHNKQTALFGTIDYWDIEIPDLAFSKEERLKGEKDVLGLYITGNPVEDYDDYRTGSQLDGLEEGEADCLVVVMAVTEKKTRNGAQMAKVILGDDSYQMEVTVFPKDWAAFGDTVRTDAVGVCTLQTKEDTVTESLHSFLKLFVPIKTKATTEVAVGYDPVALRLPRGFASNALAVSKLKGILASYPGNRPASVQLSEKSELDLKAAFNVDPSPAMLEQVGELFRRYSADKAIKR